MKKTLNYINQNKEKFLDELCELLKIPSISAQSIHDKDTRAAAEWIRDHLTNLGIENAKIMETGGHPVVYADWLNAKNAPTVLVYGHYDVQSPDPLDEWNSKPFEPLVKDGNIYARGTADDKGQLFTHLKAIESIMQTKGSLPLNLKFLIEGEEEIGGVNLDKFVEQNAKLLQADVCLISDTHSLSLTQPQIDYGLRGLYYAEIELSVMPKDVHSGLYGGNVPNAAVEMANIINQFKDPESQEILITGFYQNIREISKKEKKELANAHYNEESVLEETGAQQIVGTKNASALEKAGALPTLDVNGMKSGYIGEGPKTIIPARASAKISMRLVPHQTAKEVEQKFKKYIQEITPEYVDIKVKTLSTGEPILFDKDSEYFKKAEKALEAVFGNKPVYELSGGSIPVTATLKEILEIDTILMGFGLPDDGLHSPNEKMSLEMFYKGIQASARFLLSFEN